MLAAPRAPTAAAAAAVAVVVSVVGLGSHGAACPAQMGQAQALELASLAHSSHDAQAQHRCNTWDRVRINGRPDCCPSLPLSVVTIAVVCEIRTACGRGGISWHQCKQHPTMPQPPLESGQGRQGFDPSSHQLEPPCAHRVHWAYSYVHCEYMPLRP